MKNMIKKVLALLLAMSIVVAFAACGTEKPTEPTNPTGSNIAEPKHTKIGVALYADSGAGADALRAYLGSIGEVLNVEFVYTVLNMADEAVNVTKVQELIAAGCDGIIYTMDSAMEAVLAECADAGVYLAGYLCDFDNSYRNNYSNVFEHPNFLGTVADGGCGDEATRGYDFFDSLIEYNERNPEDPIRHVAFTTFPAFAYPYHGLFVQQFIEKLDAYNAANPDKAIAYDPYDTTTDVLMFAPLDSTYFSKHPEIDAIMSMGGGSFVYPTLVASGKADSIKLFSSGYSDGDSEIFGSKGPYQQEIMCTTESITYPLVLLLNKINGVSYKDQPAVAERRSCAVFVINSDEDMESFKRSIYFTGSADSAIFTAEEVLKATALNPDATYADLCALLERLTIENVK